MMTRDPDPKAENSQPYAGIGISQAPWLEDVFCRTCPVFTSAVTLPWPGVRLLIDEGLVQGSKEQLTLTLMFFTGWCF